LTIVHSFTPVGPRISEKKKQTSGLKHLGYRFRAD